MKKKPIQIRETRIALKEYVSPFTGILTTQDMIKYFVNKEPQDNYDHSLPIPPNEEVKFKWTPASVIGFARDVSKRSLSMLMP